jgi:hypothetical protein
MLGMILRGEAEIAVAEFTMTALRAGVVDFTVPLINTRCTASSLFPPPLSLSSLYSASTAF